jgi:hypothetical protein
VVALTGYNRWYAVQLLGRAVTHTAMVTKRGAPRTPARLYDLPVLEALRRI